MQAEELARLVTAVGTATRALASAESATTEAEAVAVRVQAI